MSSEEYSSRSLGRKVFFQDSMAFGLTALASPLMVQRPIPVLVLNQLSHPLLHLKSGCPSSAANSTGPWLEGCGQRFGCHGHRPLSSRHPGHNPHPWSWPSSSSCSGNQSPGYHRPSCSHQASWARWRGHWGHIEVVYFILKVLGFRLVAIVGIASNYYHRLLKFCSWGQLPKYPHNSDT